MKIKVICSCVIVWLIICIAIIYGVGGDIAPWLWNFCIFILAPIACLCVLINLAVILKHFIEKKWIFWNMLFLVEMLIVAYPITILFGVSFLTYPTHEKTSNEYSMALPITKGVLFGGKTYKTHAVWPSECYAYDIVKEPYDVGSKKLDDYGVYLANVMAPINGTVIGTKDTEDDILPNTDHFESALGNYIFMKNEQTGTYLILAHLEKHSLKVTVGDTVEKGMIIAKVGNSGTTSEPHLHIQHQKSNPLDMKMPICARGLPIIFK